MTVLKNSRNLTLHVGNNSFVLTGLGVGNVFSFIGWNVRPGTLVMYSKDDAFNTFATFSGGTSLNFTLTLKVWNYSTSTGSSLPSFPGHRSSLN